MTIKDCIEKAVGYLGIKDEANAEDFLDMARDVVAEICSDFYPLKTTEKANADAAGDLSVFGLSKPVIDIFEVRLGGRSIPFRIKYDHIEVGMTGVCEVEYSFMPEMSGLDSALPFSERISARVIGYGIAAEYALLNCPEDAALFDKRYKDALKKAVRQKSEKRVKARSWL